MKKEIAVLCPILVMLTQYTVLAEEPPTPPVAPVVIAVQQPEPQPYDPAPLVLQNFGGMLSSFFNMISNPNDPKHVAGCISDMIQGMVNIHHVGMKRSPAELEHMRSELEEDLLTFFASLEGKQFLERWKGEIADRMRSF